VLGRAWVPAFAGHDDDCVRISSVRIGPPAAPIFDSWPRLIAKTPLDDPSCLAPDRRQ
jgi:hypothetical protein